LIIAGTGHRPKTLGSYDPRTAQRLVDLAGAALEKYRPAQLISGMALGWDTALATAAHDLNIPFVAAVPFRGQELAWPEESRDRYHRLLAVATEVTVVSKGGFSAAKMQRRNEWMVDRCDLVLALWNGGPGGTGNCVAYASLRERKVVNLWSSWVKYSCKKT
jgi:uncharacterized phage-like protein YoqJ